MSPASRSGSPLDYVERLLAFARERACQHGASQCESARDGGPTLEDLFALLSDGVMEAQALGELDPSMTAETIARNALVLLVREIATCEHAPNSPGPAPVPAAAVSL